MNFNHDHQKIRNPPNFADLFNDKLDMAKGDMLGLRSVVAVMEMLLRVGLLLIMETGVLDFTSEEDATNIHFDNNIFRPQSCHRNYFSR